MTIDTPTAIGVFAIVAVVCWCGILIVLALTKGKRHG